MSSFKTQVGGTHYSKMVIQPAEYIHKNKIGFMEGSVIKYVSRWRDKGGVEDLRKARHFVDLLIEMECNDVQEAVKNARRGFSRIDIIGQNGNDGAIYADAAKTL